MSTLTRRCSVLALLGAALMQCNAQVPPRAAAASADPPATTSAPATTKNIYQQRQKDGSVLFTDRPPEPGAMSERTWTVPVEDPGLAEQRREKAREEARQETQAINERVQRQLERQQEREDALALERLRLNQAQAQRDAEAARADLERARATTAPIIVVLPGQRPPIGAPATMPGGTLNPRPPQVRPPVAPSAGPGPGPSSSLCLSKTADCNPSTDPARAGFGGR